MGEGRGGEGLGGEGGGDGRCVQQLLLLLRPALG